MATVTNWIEHLTTDVDTATEGVQVAGQRLSVHWK